MHNYQIDTQHSRGHHKRKNHSMLDESDLFSPAASQMVATQQSVLTSSANKPSAIDKFLQSTQQKSVHSKFSETRNSIGKPADGAQHYKSHLE